MIFPADAATALKKPAAASPAPAAAVPGTHSKNAREVTVTAIDDQAVHVTLPDGTTLEANIKPSSVFLVKGISEAPSDFPIGAKALLRTRTRASDGALSVVLLSDMVSEEAIDSYRKHILTGHVVSVTEKTVVVQPDAPPGCAFLTLHVSPKSVFRRKGAVVASTAFPVGAAVAVETRSLPSGLLMASIVSDTNADAAQTKASLKTTSLSGRAADVQADKGLLRITPRTKPGRIVAVTGDTRIKVRKAEAMLKEITPGMHVAARLTAQKDAAGHAIASSLTASDAAAPPAAKKTRAAKKMR